MAFEAKPFASLSSGLLARKGAARPAMRPQGFGQAGSSPEDLGWNDMGFEPAKPVGLPRDSDPDAFAEEFDDQPRIHHPIGLTPVNSPVHDQQTELAERLNGSADDGADEEADETAELFVPEQETVLPTLVAVEFEPVTAREAAELGQSDESSQPAPLPFKPVARAVSSAPHPTSRPRAAPGSKGKAAFTLRLDPERHLKLRLACAVDGRSAQQLVTTALDQMLERMPEVHGLAAKAKSRG